MKSSIFKILAISFLSYNQIVAQHTLIDVPAAANSGEALRIDNSVGTHRPFMSFYSEGTYRGFLQAGGTAFEIGTKNSFPLLFSLNGAEMMRIHNNGFVGIGTNTPSTGKLHVLNSSNAIHTIHAIASNTTGNTLAAAVMGENHATNTAGSGVYGAHYGGGTGVFGTSDSGYGVYGVSDSAEGVFGVSSNYIGVHGASDFSVGVRGFSRSGEGVFGISETGTGIYGQNFSNTSPTITAFNFASNTAPNATSQALKLDNGMLAVTGAHRRTAFQITLSGATSAVHVNYFGATDDLDYRGQSATDMLIVTPVTSQSLFPTPVVSWVIDHWVIYSSTDNGVIVNFPIGTKFNVLVIKTQ